MTGFELLERIGSDPSLEEIPATVPTSTIVRQGEHERLRRAARIIPKSELSADALASAIADVLSGSSAEAA